MSLELIFKLVVGVSDSLGWVSAIWTADSLCSFEIAPALLTRMAASSRQIARGGDREISMCWPYLPSQPLCHSFYLDPLVLSSMASAWIPSHKCADILPNLQGSPHMPTPKRSLPDSSPIRGMLSPSSPSTCTSLWNLHFILHYNNLCACLSSCLHPFLENIKSHDPISSVYIFKAPGAGTSVPEMLSYGLCTTGTKLLWSFRGCVRQLSSARKPRATYFISVSDFSHLKNKHNRTYLKGTSWRFT